MFRDLQVFDAVTSNRRAMPVLIFSAQSLRRSVSAGPQPGDRVPDPAAAVRSPLRAGELALQSPQPDPLPPGQGEGNTASRRSTTPPRPTTPRSMPTASPLPGAGIRSGDHGEGDVPAARAVHGHPVAARARRHRAGPAEPHPHRPWAPRTWPPSGIRCVHPICQGHVPRSGGPATRLALRRGGGRRPGRRTPSWPGRSRAGPAAGPSGSRRPATGAPAAPGWAPGTAPGSPARPGGGPGAGGRTARRPGSTRTGHARSGPAAPPAGRGWEQPVPRHANTLSDTTDVSGEVTRRFPPGLKARVSTPRF